MLDGLCNVNIELTSRCNKRCWMCGRRKREKDNPTLELQYGDMDFGLVEKIAAQLPPGIIVQLHNNGEPLLYPRFGEAVRLFPNQIVNIVTNGKLLVKKVSEIIGSLDTLTISIIENDMEADEQYEVLKEFLYIKDSRRPLMILRFLGQVNQKRYEEFNLLTTTRLIHSPMGSFDYKKGEPTKPEAGICLDFLHHLAIDYRGDVSICVRYDPHRLGVLGNIANQSLDNMWNGYKRMQWLSFHRHGKRDAVPLCAQCHFWGVPTG